MDSDDAETSTQPAIDGSACLREWRPTVWQQLFPPKRGEPWHTGFVLHNNEFDLMSANRSDPVAGNSIADRVLASRGWRRPDGAAVGVTLERELVFVFPQNADHHRAVALCFQLQRTG